MSRLVLAATVEGFSGTPYPSYCCRHLDGGGWRAVASPKKGCSQVSLEHMLLVSDPPPHHFVVVAFAEIMAPVFNMIEVELSVDLYRYIY